MCCRYNKNEGVLRRESKLQSHRHCCPSLLLPVFSVPLTDNVAVAVSGINPSRHPVIDLLVCSSHCILCLVCLELVEFLFFFPFHFYAYSSFTRRPSYDFRLALRRPKGQPRRAVPLVVMIVSLRLCRARQKRMVLMNRAVQEAQLKPNAHGPSDALRPSRTKTSRILTNVALFCFS